MSSKRQATTQITKDDFEAESSDHECEDTPITNVMPRASAAVLAQRRIVKANRDDQGNVVHKKSNPFQNISLVVNDSAKKDAGNVPPDNDKSKESNTEQPSSSAFITSHTKTPDDNDKKDKTEEKETKSATPIFGSGTIFTAGFGAVKKTTATSVDSSNNESISSDSNKAAQKIPVFGSSTAFTGGFGSTIASSGTGGGGFQGFKGFGSSTPGFGAAASNLNENNENSGQKTFLFTTSSANSFENAAPRKSTDEAESSSPTSATVALPKDYTPLSGEEEEDCILQMRAKLFRRAPLQDANATDKSTLSTTTATSTQSVPPSASMATTTAPSKSTSEDDDDHSHDNDADKKGRNESSVDVTASSTKDTREFGWKEVGIGPVRVLQRRDNQLCRLVMRQEEKPGGVGFRVILNTRWDKVETMSDQFLLLIADNGDIYCVKFKLASEAQEFLQIISSLNSAATTSENAEQINEDSDSKKE